MDAGVRVVYCCDGLRDRAGICLLLSGGGWVTNDNVSLISMVVSCLLLRMVWDSCLLSRNGNILGELPGLGGVWWGPPTAPFPSWFVVHILPSSPLSQPPMSRFHGPAANRCLVAPCWLVVSSGRSTARELGSNVMDRRDGDASSFLIEFIWSISSPDDPSRVSPGRLNR